MKNLEKFNAENFKDNQLLFKRRFISFLLTVLFLTGSVLHSQNYTFRTYLNDDEIAGTIKHNFKVDTIRKYIGQFHDRLGYEYYLYESVLKYPENKRLAINYLDTAFARGLDTLCAPPLIKKMFGDSILNTSRSHNFFKAYDLKLKQQIDSLKKEDQKYRQLAFPMGAKRVELGDSITAIWKLTDSSNVLFLKALIKKHGYPTANKIGYDFCTTGSCADPEIIIQHLGTEERDFQIALLKQVIELCLKNEENWQKIYGLQFNLHNRFSYSYSEFTFLYFKEHKLDVENSLFSLWVMARILRTPFKTMYIKCSSERTFTELKTALLELNWMIPFPPHMEDLAKWGLPIQKKMAADQLVFELDKSVRKDKVYYKIVD